MIREVEGDILHTQAHAIAHGVAPNDFFTHGLSLNLRQRWPAMYQDFLHLNEKHQPQPGDVFTWRGVGGVQVVHLFTQDNLEGLSPFTGPASLDNVKRCMSKLQQVILEQGIVSLALPRIATGAGGLEWEDVRDIMYPPLEKLHIPTVVYTDYVPGIAANERILVYNA